MSEYTEIHTHIDNNLPYLVKLLINIRLSLCVLQYNTNRYHDSIIKNQYARPSL